MFFTEKKNFFWRKSNIIESPKNRTFPKGLTHAAAQKIPIFPFFLFRQNKTRNKV